MTNKYSYSRFFFFKTTLDNVVRLYNRKLFAHNGDPLWGQRHTCRVSTGLMEKLCEESGKQEQREKSEASVLFLYAPRACPHYTVGIITQMAYPIAWVGKIASDLEMMEVRFTLPGKDDAIRELILHKGDDLLRYIRVMKDPKWELFLDGTRQNFEDGYHYDHIPRKRAKDYFTLEMLMEYCTRWGFPLGKDNFFESDYPAFLFGDPAIFHPVTHGLKMWSGVNNTKIEGDSLYHYLAAPLTQTEA